MEKKLFNSLCIFCYQSVSAFKIKNLGDIRCPEKFVRIFLRYLDISSNVEGQKLSMEQLSFCDDCTKRGELFCESFSQLESVRLQLDWKVRQIYETMNCAAIVQKRKQTEDEVCCQSTIISHHIQKLRKNIIEQCKLKLRATQPRVFLKRCLYNSELAIKKDEPASQKKNCLEGFDETPLPNNDNIDLMRMLMRFIVILHLSLPLQHSSHTNRACGVIHKDLNLITETNNVAGNGIQLPCDASILSQNHPDLESKNVAKSEAQNPDALFAVNTSFVNQDSNQAIQQHQAPLDSNVSTQIMSQKCKICDASFPRPLQLRTHMKLVHNLLVPFECQICGKELKSLYRFRGHMVSVHRTASGIPGTIKCSLCQERFATVRGLKTHISEVHKAHKYKCNHCSKTFQTKSTLYSHNYRFHMKKKYGNSLPENVLVPKKRDQLQQIHSDTKLHNSSIPAHSFSESNQPHSHNPEDAQQRCLICEAPTTDMQQHIQTIHNVEGMDPSKVARCSLCSARFTHQKYLKCHLKIAHKQAVWKYGCREAGCEKRYRSKSDLKKHEKIHTNEQPSFLCDYCGKSFSQYSTMRSHRFNFHESEPNMKKTKTCEQMPNVNTTATELPAQPVKIEFNNQPYSGRGATVQPDVWNGVESMAHYQFGYSNSLNTGVNFTFPGTNPPSSAITQKYNYTTGMNAGSFYPASSNGTGTPSFYCGQGRNMPYSEYSN